MTEHIVRHRAAGLQASTVGHWGWGALAVAAVLGCSRGAQGADGSVDAATPSPGESKPAFTQEEADKAPLHDLLEQHNVLTLLDLLEHPEMQPFRGSSDLAELARKSCPDLEREDLVAKDEFDSPRAVAAQKEVVKACAQKLRAGYRGLQEGGLRRIPLVLRQSFVTADAWASSRAFVYWPVDDHSTVGTTLFWMQEPKPSSADEGTLFLSHAELRKRGGISDLCGNNSTLALPRRSVRLGLADPEVARRFSSYLKGRTPTAEVLVRVTSLRRANAGTGCRLPLEAGRSIMMPMTAWVPAPVAMRLVVDGAPFTRWVSWPMAEPMPAAELLDVATRPADWQP